MKKIASKILLMAILLAGLNSCTGDDLEYVYDTEVDAGNVKFIKLRADHRTLLPTGRATMRFYAEAYNILELPDYTPTMDGDSVIYKPHVVRDTSLIPQSMLPEGLVRLYDDQGNEYPDFTYSTTDKTPRTVRFHLQAGELRSDEVSVDIRPLPDTTQWRDIEVPIIFHVLNPTEQVGVAQITITESDIDKCIDRLNQVFAGQASTDPNGWNTHITFSPALYDNDGAKLTHPGYHAVTVSSKTAITDDEGYQNYVMEHKELIFDYTRFLNVWVVNNKKGSSSIASAPNVIDNDEHPIPGLTPGTIDAEFPQKATDVGLFVNMSYMINPNQQTDHYEFASTVARHLGLLPTMAYRSLGTTNMVDGDTDYCNDTPYYWNLTQSVFKNNAESTKPGSGTMYFTSYNVMDSYSYKNSITADQCARLQLVLEHCPSRWYWKSRFAFTGRE